MARLAVALSGGVDSTCAAWLLKQAGHELLGLTLNLGPHSAATCLAAARAAQELGIEHQVVDASEQFAAKVVNYSANAYAQGFTPNPCARCNAHIKIPLLAEVARAGACSALATGHYARLVVGNGLTLLAEAADKTKSQAYFLARLRPEQLAFLQFPLGDMSKEQVRQMAARLGLSAAKGKESQDCCFLPRGGFSQLSKGAPGLIVDTQGKTLGKHKGLHHFTVGQRRGLNISAAAPLYVLAIEPQNSTVVVGAKAELMQSQVVGHSYLEYVKFENCEQVSARLRYTRHGIACSAISRAGGKVRVSLAQAYAGVAPGQLLVLNQGEIILGSAWIGRSNDE